MNRFLSRVASRICSFLESLNIVKDIAEENSESKEFYKNNGELYPLEQLESDTESMGEFARSLGVGRTTLFNWMREQEAIIQKNSRLPYQRFIDSGYFIVVRCKYGKRKEKSKLATRITPKGVDFVTNRWKLYCDSKNPAPKSQKKKKTAVKKVQKKINFTNGPLEGQNLDAVFIDGKYPKTVTMQHHVYIKRENNQYVYSYTRNDVRLSA